MILNIVFLAAGLLLILGGASLLTDGASAIAKRHGVSDLVIGLTVVAFGTSAPELVISVVSAISDNAEIAIGNAVGSNIFNTLVILGATALVKPIKVTRSILTGDIPLVVLSALALLAMANGPLLDGAPAAVLTRVDGILLLLFFAVFMRYTFSQAATAAPGEPEEEKGAMAPQMAMWKAWLWVVGGLAALIGGGELFVDGASGVAKGLGVSDAVIGLTIVAAGTSLPELATSVMAAVKNKPGIALGNVIGSNIFNIFMVLGAAATIRPLPLGSVGNFDLLTLTGACVLFWIFARYVKVRTITRAEGMVLLAAYVGYIATLLLKIC